MGTPIRAPATMIAVALRSAFCHAFGSSGAAATKSISRSSAATSRGSAMLLASGMKISAEPKPEKPRAVPETKAIAQIAIAALMLISAGMRLERLMLYFSASCPQRAAGLLRHLGHDLRRHRIDLLVGERLLARLNRHGDGDRLLVGVDALAFI